MSEEDYKEIFNNAAEELRNYLFFKCRNLSQAQDLMQESFLRLWQNRKKVPTGKALAYLYTVGNRLFLDQKRHEKVVFKFIEQLRASVDREDPHYLAEVQEFRQQLDQILNEMPEKWRTVFLMNRIEKITYREIAERLGLSVKAVEKRMHNALKHMQEIYPTKPR